MTKLFSGNSANYVAASSHTFYGGIGGAVGLGGLSVDSAFTVPASSVTIGVGATDTGKLQIGGPTIAGCIMLGDTDRGGCTECFALNGALTCTTDADCLCDGQ
jgi:hypothetical protein